MQICLYFGTIVLIAAGIFSACCFIWLNSIADTREQLPKRNIGLLKVINTSIVLSFVFGLISCLLIDIDLFVDAIFRTVKLYWIIAISWMVIMALCGLALIFNLLRKKIFSENKTKAIKKVFYIALRTVLLGALCAWLLT